MSREASQRTTSNNKILHCIDLEICFRFVGPQGDELAANVWGQGTDSGDKATQKAVTSAFKTMLSVVFCISDSEMDAEAHDVPETTRPAPASKERIDGIVDRVAAANLADWVREQNYAWPWSDAVCSEIAGKLDGVPVDVLMTPAKIEASAAKAEPVMTRAESQANEAAKAATEPTHCPECGAGPLEAHAESCSIAPF